MFSFVDLPNSPTLISPYTPRCKFASTSQGRIHQSGSHPPVKVASTSQGRTHQSRSHPPANVALQRGVPCGSAVRSACPAVHSTNRSLPYQWWSLNDCAPDLQARVWQHATANVKSGGKALTSNGTPPLLAMGYQDSAWTTKDQHKFAINS